MALQSHSNSFDEIASADPDSNSETTPTEVYSAPLGINGAISGLYLSNEEFNRISLLDDLAADRATRSVVVNSPGTNIGDEFHVNVQGPTNITVNHISPVCPPSDNGSQKDGQVINSDSSPKAQQIHKQLKDFLKRRPTLIWSAAIVLAIMSISSLVVFFCLYNFGAPSPEAPTTGHDDNLGDDIQVIQRKEWSARPPLKVTKVSGPLKKVRILHTAGSTCKDFQTCTGKVQGLQSWQVSTQGMPDISYNYLIGGDGNVYVGRGPDVENQWQKDAIDIVYIGNFLAPYDQMTDKMDEAGRRLIERLREEGYLTPDYIVIAHNQTYNTQSPGDNIYKRIVKWPHFDSGLYFQK